MKKVEKNNEFKFRKTQPIYFILLKFILPGGEVQKTKQKQTEK